MKGMLCYLWQSVRYAVAEQLLTLTWLNFLLHQLLCFACGDCKFPFSVATLHEVH